VLALDREGRAIWIADAHRDDRKRFVVRADEKLTAFLELLHVLLSAQIKIGHAAVWMRIRVCVSFILRPSLLCFGFASWFARILRETFTWIADEDRGDGKRYVVRAEEKVAAFLELEAAVRGCTPVSCFYVGAF